MDRIRARIALAIASLATCISANAAAASAFTVEDIWRPPKMRDVSLSRDGRQLAATVPLNGRMNLAVMDLDKRNAVMVTSYDDFDVLNVTWVGSERLLYTLGQLNSPTGPSEIEGGGLFMASRDGKESRRISMTVREMRAQGQFVYRRLELLRTIPGNDEEVIAQGNMTSAESLDLYRLNIRTGRYTLLTLGRPAEQAQNWILDGKLVPRVVTAGIKDKLTRVVHYRKDEKSDWVEIARYEANKGPTFVPLAFDADDRTLQVAYNGGRDTMAIFRYDPATREIGEMIAQHPRFDMGAAADGSGLPGVVTDPETGRILGYAVNAARPEVAWVDEKYAAMQSGLDRALPGRVNFFERTPDGKRFLVTSYSDTLPVRWYLYDQARRAIEEVGTSRPWLDGKLVEQRFFTFRTRDGLEIGGYYFLPANAPPGKKLPTVVHIHGGPMVRADSWGRGFGYIEGQLFASRGYAVIVPNFRITPGLGSRIYYGGFGTFGRQMSDDHEDALKWGIEQGFVDPGRVCLSGASYGGYAALQALARSNALWKCAVAGLAVTDLKFQLTTPKGDTAFNESAVTLWKSVLGVNDVDAPAVREISPVFFADRIKRPVFLYAGQNDIRVPIDQIEAMAAALAKAGNPPSAFVVKEKEGHGFGKLENNVDLYNRILQFLDAQIGK